MRSKEVDNAIEIVKYFNEKGFYMLMLKYNNDRIQTNTRLKTSTRTVLNYISELEESNKMIGLLLKNRDELTECGSMLLKENNKLKEKIEDKEKQYIHKDKIREIIEKERCKTIDGYNDWKYDKNVYDAELNMINIVEKAILEGE